MYEKHFGFRERPFALTPDPAFLYQSSKHSVAYAMLEYGVSSNIPVVLITGEIGSGKTTLVRHLLDRLGSSTTVGLISNTHRGFGEILQWVCMAFGLAQGGGDRVSLYRNLVDFLIGEYAQGRRALLIVDEAQNMAVDTLEELRLLTNINADKNVVLQLVLVGQPELRATLNRPELEQFAQRISTDYHIGVLDRRETRDYIRHRLSIAGATRNPFAPDAMDVIYQCAGGVPRMINILCDTALVYTFAEDRLRVTGKLVTQMVEERRRRGLFGAGKQSLANDPQEPTVASAAELDTRLSLDSDADDHAAP